MKCAECLKPITRGMEERKRIEIRLIMDAEVPCGQGQKRSLEEGALLGQLLRALHSKCFHIKDNAARRQAAIRQRRAADPGHVEHEDRDWRDPSTVQIEDLLSNEGFGSERQAGRADQ